MGWERSLPSADKMALEDCPYCAHFTDSKNHAWVESFGKIRPQAYPLNHRKPDSPSQTPQF